MIWQWIRTLNPQTAPRSIYPFIHKSQNVKTASDATRESKIGILPLRLPNLSFEIGDFVQNYSQEKHRAAWDVVVTHFFIDTASNILDYLRTIRYCLKEGGVWHNFGKFALHASVQRVSEIGPLLWHDKNGIHLTLDQLKDVAAPIGLQIKVSLCDTAVYISAHL